MPLNIQPHGMFHTPKSQEELLGWIEKHSGSEKAVAMTAAMMTWNYLAGVVAEYQGDTSSQNPYANIGDPEDD